jgi:hypothetical protein
MANMVSSAWILPWWNCQAHQSVRLAGSHRSIGSRDSISSKSSGEKKTRRPTNLKKVWVQKYGGAPMLGDRAW